MKRLEDTHLKWADDHVLRIKNGNVRARIKGAVPFHNALRCAWCVALLDDRLPGAPHNRILDGLPSVAKPSHIIVVIVAQELVVTLIVGRDVRKVDFVSQNTANSTKALDELRALLRLVRDKLRTQIQNYASLEINRGLTSRLAPNSVYFSVNHSNRLWGSPT